MEAGSDIRGGLSEFKPVGKRIDEDCPLKHAHARSIISLADLMHLG